MRNDTYGASGSEPSLASHMLAQPTQTTADAPVGLHSAHSHAFSGGPTAETLASLAQSEREGEMATTREWNALGVG